MQKVAMEQEGHEYGACRYVLNKQRIVSRIAKVTLKKAGQFVTLWKRSSEGPIVPYDIHDMFDMVIIIIGQSGKLGQFIFPKNKLYRHGVLSENGKGGKRAFRVYLPWEKMQNKQAKKTQSWQACYFVALQPTVNVCHLQKLLIL